MKQLYSDIKEDEIDIRIGQKINSYLIGLDRSRKNDKQKILELCQVGKFLVTFFNEFEILQITEKPDFIISNGQQKIGVEHELILDVDSKSKEGFYENICEKVEANLILDTTLPNFLINLYLKDNLSYKIRDKNYLINQLTILVRNYVLTGKLIPNEIVHRVFMMNHSQKNVCPNFGAYIQKAISKDLIFEYVSKKEVKCNVYKENTDLPQWLVLIIGGAGKSSYRLNKPFHIDLDTNFDKVFLFEDFYNKLYELK